MDSIVDKYSSRQHAPAELAFGDFALPAADSPAAFLRAHTDDARNPDARIKIQHGTTTLSFIYEGGIVVCVDSRASAGSWIASQSVKKVLEINSYLLGTMAGGAADCQFWQRWLGSQCRLYELRNKERISVSSASKVLANVMYQYKGSGLSMGTMICGYTKFDKPEIYYVDSDGSRVPGSMFCVGSGQTFAYGVLDEGYRWDLTQEEALALGKRAILGATHRDAYSGGSVNVFHMTPAGWTYHGNYDVGEAIWLAKEQEGSFNNIVT